MIKEIYINSANSDVGGSGSSFSITKTQFPFTTVPRKVKLIYAEIPYVWNNIIASNNSYGLSYTGFTIPTQYITPGYYTGTTLSTSLQNSLNAALVNTGITATVTYNVSNFKFTISFAGIGQYNLLLDLTVANSIYLALGLNNQIYTFTSVNNSITSVGLSVIQNYAEVFVCSNMVEGIDNGIVAWYPGNLPTQTASNSILAIIPINTPYGSYIIYYAPDSEPWQTISPNIFNYQNSNSYINFSLYYKDGTPVDLQNTNWSAKILFEF